MARSEDADADAALSDPLTEETTATKRQRLNSSTETLSSLTSPSSSSSSTIPTLPFEIVAEILSRLPVKFLMQLQSVCKSWKSLISDPKFIKKHLHLSTTRLHLVLAFANSSRKFALSAYPLSSFFTDVTSTATQLDYPLNNRIRNLFDLIVGSCHGILCFVLDQRFALLWNPSIKKFTKSPSLDNPKRDGSYTIYGFGYDHVNDIYKVVAVYCFESDNGDYKTQVKVHTLGTNFWRRIHDFPFGVPFDESGKFVSGTVNWLASNDSSYTSSIIVSLDLEKETYQELLQPDYGAGAVNVVTKTLSVLRDRMCILAHSYTFFDVWLMEEYGNRETWTKLFRVPYIGNVGHCPYTNALYVTEDDQVLLENQFELVAETDPELKKIREERGYSYMDVCEVCPEKLPNYEEKIKNFFEEHLHTDEEIRYCVAGSGYFDVRDRNEAWIRVWVKKGGMIILPAGIYHRFTLDESNYIKALRFFVGEPIWTPYNRPHDHLPARGQYIKTFVEKDVASHAVDATA